MSVCECYLDGRRRRRRRRWSRRVAAVQWESAKVTSAARAVCYFQVWRLTSIRRRWRCRRRRRCRSTGNFRAASEKAKTEFTAWRRCATSFKMIYLAETETQTHLAREMNCSHSDRLCLVSGRRRRRRRLSCQT